MAADSSMGFHQGITASVYNHHHHNMLSFQSNSDASMGGGGGASGMGFVTPRSMSGTSSSTAGLFISTNNNGNGVFGNASVVGPSSRSSSSGDAFRGGTSAPKHKFVTGSPSEWTDREVDILKEGLARYGREPNIMRYIKIAAMLPNRTIRDVALRCCWSTGKDRRKKPDGFFSGKKIRDMKPMQDKMVASSTTTNFNMAPTNNLNPFSISMQNPNQQCQVPKEAPVVDSATQQLLEENNQLLTQIAGNIETFKTEENTSLFLQTNNNIKTILSRMSETPGIMSQMPPLPEFVHEDQLNSLLHVDRMVAAHASHMKLEPRS
ncbi:uncharacterized protein LOC100843322 isoform X2 [Brachypodium distachyon]|uniref:Myb-like domain-containing protein n=1 Tax=Brachypodium distachyon TaxID=15368 RepID=I1J394_BRADI|nr:uncharacterized protein LOC100843322 isoform X2 [Brachypodium distachyon]KQJ85243.1 hypothetical protein BRADI_5g25850v3 [Brachypodium distachyon]KQJ85244.1 hypothetical protein BRADI_5g25850v3 [Brachypodium distachyon]PNT62121.1 hypothetical protein BRADI_5g25850v3 [Brachypodium distachyon]|eukprot:XP_003580802.1 uncharacterized protein LOC100843322 isoform X2 [Brachypodium distachyon]